ncbi:MAG: 16S rRNA (adenine(1518)-N(6)/adenine(1519)-N(6))-dimethyltransferase RsmA [Desulfovermiculus sp.]|nr:16S rRNA (adenine(1518)-N(6)/adenine(1519)-N(6))-dimethyltransferase RsmA [Desulfovermiculus sp.]
MPLAKLGPEDDLRPLKGEQRAKRSLGQNFLVDPNLARKIVDCLLIRPGDRVLEIGPGRGALTGLLLDRGAQVVGVEKDDHLARELKKRWPDMQVVAVDALDISWDRLSKAGIHKVIGNLPYNVASPLIWDIVACFPEAVSMVFTVQKEVGLRLTASPGAKAYGALSVWVQNFVQPRLEFIIGPQVFRPRPRVDSAVISLLPLRQRPGPKERAALSGLLRVCFQQRRKQLKTSLRSVWSDHVQSWFLEHNVRPQARAEEMTPKQFLSLAQVIGT